MMRRLVLALMVVLLATVWVVPADAQWVCGARTEIVKRLDKAFSETPVGRGLSADGAIIEIFASPTGSWTALVSYPGGRSCVAAIGEGWERLEPRLSLGGVAAKADGRTVYDRD